MIVQGLRGLLAAVVLAGPAMAETLYAPPKGCEAIATLRLPNCLVKHVSACPRGNIADHFRDGRLLGRAHYDHPALFVRFDSADGRATGHLYGEGAPGRLTELEPGARYRYSRDVERTDAAAMPGDTGTEVMEVGRQVTLTLDGQQFDVLDIRFRVTNSDTGYDYRERALMHRAPRFTVGAIGTHFDEEGVAQSRFSTVPESLSLPGQRLFRSHIPAASCHVSS